MDSTRKALADADSLFQFNLALCRLADHTADFSSVEEVPGQGGDEDEADHHHRHHAADAHSDIEAHYRYHCENPDELPSLSTNIRAEFPGILSLQVQWVVGGRQGAATLDNSQRHVIFR